MADNGDVQQKIAGARKEAAELQEQIKQHREKTNDAKLTDLESPELPPLKLKPRRALEGHLAKIYSLAWCSDSTHLVSASQDGKLIVWNALTNYKHLAIPLRSHWVMCCDYSPSGKLVACGGLDNICSVFNIGNATGAGNQGSQSNNNQNNQGFQEISPLRELSSHTGYLSSCKFLNDRHILTSSGDSTCILWDIEINQPVSRFSDHTGDCMSVSISPMNDNNQFVSGGCDAAAKLWDIRQNKCVSTFTGHESDINSVEFFPNGYSFATGSDDCSCRLFDIRAARELMIYSDDNIREGITSISFSKTGRVLFSAYEDKKVIAWDVLKGKQLQTMEDHQNRVSCLQVSPDGNALATGSWDSTLKIIA